MGRPSLVVWLALCACRGGFDEPGPITVVVHSQGRPAEALPVVFHDPYGNVTMIVPTDPDGRAIGELLPGGSVTAVWITVAMTSRSYLLQTMAGVEPGDEIVLGRPFDPWQGAGEVQVTLPGTVPTATRYEIRHGCATDTVVPPAMPMLRSRPRACTPNGHAAVYAVAMTTTATLAYSGVVDLPLVIGQPASAPLGPWRTDWVATSGTIRNLPPGATLVGAYTEELRDGIAYDRTTTESMGGAQLDFAAKRPGDFGDGFGVLASARFADGEVALYYRTPALPDDPPLDIDFARALPQIIDARIVPSAAGRPRIAIAVAESMSIDNADAAQITASWPGTGTDTLTWMLNTPPANEIQLPTLPPFMRDVIPTADTLFAPPSVTVWDADFVDGRADVRDDNWFDIFGETIYFLPPTLELRYSRWTAPPP